jgi:5-methyltetrahydropteroyltriglutamate--homocysteine methyltransferase
MVHTTVVGNYPRIGDSHDEQKLRRAIGKLDRGEITESDLRDVEREVVRDAIREQVEAGIEVVTDGQVTWYDSQSHIARRLAGIEIDGLVRYFNTNTYYRQPVVGSEVSRRGPILVDEWTYAASVSRRPVKAILTGPVTLASLAKDQHYGDRKSLARVLSRALAEEVAALVKAGATHIQVDEPILARDGSDLGLVREALEPIAAAKGPAELTLFVYFGDVAKIYKDVLKLPADVIGLDLVEGAKTWAKVAKEGADKPLVLGAVDARNTKPEDPKGLASKVRGLRKVLDLEACYLSPSNGLEFLPRDKAREKLAILAKAAALLGDAR